MSTLAPAADPTNALLKTFEKMDPSEAFRRLQSLVQSQPDLGAIENDYSCPPETLKWLGRLDAVVGAMQMMLERASLKVAIGQLLRTQGRNGSSEILAVLYQALAAAELAAPASEQGAFIAAGNPLDAYAAISKVLATATTSLLVVDPYLDGKALTDFMPSADEGVAICILVDQASLKPTLPPASEKWKAQFGGSRPLEIRISAPRSLHDRLIVVDDMQVWSLSQSLKDFASRAHGEVLKVDGEIGQLKIEAYSSLWLGGSPL